MAVKLFVQSCECIYRLGSFDLTADYWGCLVEVMSKLLITTYVRQTWVMLFSLTMGGTWQSEFKAMHRYACYMRRVEHTTKYLS